MTLVTEADATELARLREALKESYAAQGVSVSYTDLLVLVVGRALRWEETMPHGAPLFAVGYFEDCRWGNEGAFTWLDLAPGGFRVQSMLGWSGHGMPFFMLRNNLAGQLVRTLQKTDATTSILEWDLETANALPVGSGVYIFHVDVPGVGAYTSRVVVFMEKERLNSF